MAKNPTSLRPGAHYLLPLVFLHDPSPITHTRLSAHSYTLFRRVRANTRISLAKSAAAASLSDLANNEVPQFVCVLFCCCSAEEARFLYAPQNCVLPLPTNIGVKQAGFRTSLLNYEAQIIALQLSN